MTRASMTAPEGAGGEQGSGYWLETLGCPKNAVDSAKLAGVLEAQGYRPSAAPEAAALIVVNTCAFIEAAREESVATVLGLLDAKATPATRVVVTGCMAERYRDELAAALPEVDLVAGFGESPVPARTGVRVGSRRRVPAFDLLNLPRPPASTSWAYLKIAEGCDRGCGFCAIPQFRGPQRSRSVADVLSEAEALVAGGVRELVLVAQDPVRFGRDRGAAGGLRPDDAAPPLALASLLEGVAARVDWVRVLYLYPSGISERLVDAICSTGVPYFDLSLQHASGRHLRRMRRWGDDRRFGALLERVRRLEPSATFRSSFVVGFPGETEEDQRALVRFLEAAQLDWAGFFAFSPEEGTPAAATPPGPAVPSEVVAERLAECSEVQDAITLRRRQSLVGSTLHVLVDEPGRARSVHEAPEIDGAVLVPPGLGARDFHDVVVREALGTELRAVPA